MPPGMPGHSPGIGISYHLQRARRLLAEAGFPDGRGFPVLGGLAYAGTEAMTGYLRDQWLERFGITVLWDTVAVSQLIERLEQQPPNLRLSSWSADYPDPDNFLRDVPRKRFSRRRNVVFDRLIEAARRATDQAARLELFRQADKILVDEAAIVPLAYYGRQSLLVKPWVKKYPTSPVRWWFWKDVVIETHG